MKYYCYVLKRKYAVTALKYCFDKAVQMRGHNLCFCKKNMKNTLIIPSYQAY